MAQSCSTQFLGDGNMGVQFGSNTGNVTTHIYHPTGPSDLKVYREGNAFQRSLWFPEMEHRKHDIDDAADNTCLWLIEHSQYLSWLDAHRSVLWVRGKPGSGKSTLMKHAINQDDKHTTIPILSFFFHGRGSDLQKTPLGLFRGLCHELLSKVPDVLTAFNPLFLEKVKTKGEAGVTWEWHVGELQALFQKMISHALTISPIQIFIDALDECGENNARKLVEYFERLNSMQFEGKAFHICYSCRHYPELATGSSIIDVEMENHHDIETFVRTKFGKEWQDEVTAASIGSTTIVKAAGVFQWVTLVTNRIIELNRRGKSQRAILQALADTPTELDKLYHQILLQIPKTEQAESVLLLQWTCFAQRPLSTDEFRWAMLADRMGGSSCTLHEYEDLSDYVETAEKMERVVKSLSGGLAEIRSHKDQRIVQLVHQSVHDFLLSDGLQMLKGTSGSVIGLSHSRLCQSCTKYLVTSAITFINEQIESVPPFLEYAVSNWTAHAEISENENINQASLLSLWQWPSYKLLDFWITMYGKLSRNSARKPEPGTTIVHISARYGLLSLLKEITSYDINIDDKDVTGMTPLSWAAANGHETVVQLLLMKTDVDVNSEDIYGQTPIFKAIEAGHGPVLMTLLEIEDVFLDIADNEGITPIGWAASRGHITMVKHMAEKGVNLNDGYEDGQIPLLLALDNEQDAMVVTLLELGAELDSNATVRERVFFWASEKGYHNLVMNLLKTSVDVNVKDSFGRTALLLATANGHTNIVCSLIEYGTKLNYKDYRGRSVLLVAAENNHSHIFQLLVSHGADLGIQDALGRGLVRKAVEENSKSAIQILVQGGAPIDTVDNFGMTALRWGVEHRNVSMVEVLAAYGADVNMRDGSGITPLERAVGQLQVEMVEILTKAGADANARDINQLPILHLAAKDQDERILRILTEAGADLEATDALGQTVLQRAANQGLEITLRVMAKAGANIDVKDKRGWTLLHIAVSSDMISTVRQLLELGADYEATIQDIYITPLHQAAEKGNLETVQLLLDRGASIYSRSTDGKTPFFQAVSCGHLEVVRLFVIYNTVSNFPEDHGSTRFHEETFQSSCKLGPKHPVNIPDKDGITPLHEAIFKDHKNMVKELLIAGADINPRSTTGLTPLHEAVNRGLLDIVTTLLDHGADVHSMLSGGQSLLHEASSRGLSDMVQVLLDHGANVHLVSYFGQSPLHIAASQGLLDIARMLLDHGAVAHVVSLDRYTPLHRAANRGFGEVSEILLEHGANPHAVSRYGWTPLHEAASGGSHAIDEELFPFFPPVTVKGSRRTDIGHNHITTVKTLLSYGADIDSVADDGRTALHIAAGSGLLDIVQCLISFDADWNRRDQNARIPRDLAAANGHKKVVKFLISLESNHGDIRG